MTACHLIYTVFGVSVHKIFDARKWLIISIPLKGKITHKWEMLRFLKRRHFPPRKSWLVLKVFRNPHIQHIFFSQHPLKICLRFLANDLKITEKNSLSITSHLVIYVQQMQICSWFSEGNPIFCWKKSKARFFSSYSNSQTNFPYVVRFHIYKNQQLHQPKPQLSNPRPRLLFYFILFSSHS